MVNVQIDYASEEKLVLKLLPNSDVPLQLSKLFPGVSIPLETLGEAVTADRARAYLTRTLKAEKESFLLTTPRHRVRFFKDRYDPHAVIVLSAEENTFYRWEEDRKRGSPCTVIWTTRASQPGLTNGSTLGHTNNIPISGAPTGFWDFWGSLLNKERDALEKLIDLPGWAYSKRRVSLNGGFEFRVGDYRDVILQTCGNTFLIECPNGEPDKGRSGQNFLLFEIQRSESSEWIAGVPRRSVNLAKIPPQAHIRVDWIGTAAELRRRQDALHRLRLGLSALPSLGEMLPDGPKTSSPPVPFTPILPTPYNTEQAEAIGKALVSGSLTCILGPPGTGKTSVIAEIAAQLADAGKRVLISSQSNLAVDNALEKVTNLKQIFAIRIGRPESVKLNPELLLDNASLRYRDLLLAGSLQAESVIALGIKELRDHLPSEVLLDTWIEQSRRYREFHTALAKARETHRLRQARRDQDTSDLHAAKVHLNALCVKNGISIADTEDFLRTTGELIRAGVPPMTAHSKRARIVFARANRSEIVSLAGKSARLIQIRSELNNLDAQVLRNQGHISEFFAKEKFLGNARQANESYDREKANAGFFKSMWLGITGPPHDLVNLEQQLSQARTLRDEADQLLPTLRIRLQDLDLKRASCDEESLALIKSIRYEFQVSSSEILSIAADLSADLELATKVESAGGLRYLPVLDQHEVIDKATAWLKRARTSARGAQSQHAIAEATLLALTSDAKTMPNPDKHLKSIAILLRLDLPEDSETRGVSLAQNEWEEAFRTLRSLHQDATSQVARWPTTVAALSIYRARLNQPVLDLQRAVLSEANVIGATCSGIAGAKDFDTDFDCVIVDEAGRTTPLDILMPLVRGKSIVLVGDYKQLPPFIGDQLKEELTDIEKNLIERSIFQTIYESSHADRRQALRKQYRMASAICDIVREISYQDPALGLETAGAALERSHSIPGLRAIHWIKPTGPKNITRSPGERGLVNQAEVEAAVDIFKRIASHQSMRPGNPYSIGIISMYKQQSQAIERAIGRVYTDYPAVHVEIGTVDSFQGREKDAIILTFSETDPRRRRFFYDRRRLNVALSRAKELLVLIGSLDTLGRTRLLFGINNPIYDLRFLIESGINICSSSETFNA